MSLQTEFDQIPELVGKGKFKMTDPDESPVVRELLDKLGLDWKKQIYTAWRFNFKEALRELQHMANTKDFV